MIIAVDGPAASGKGTLSKSLAARYGLAHLDTGRTYRAVAHAMAREGAAPDDAHAAVRLAHSIDFAALDDPALSTPRVAQIASKVAVLPALREVLVTRQRAFAAAAAAGAVLDGRDIATVVCPDADIKLFITAAPQERARRRSIEAFGKADGPDYDALLAAIIERDERDANRATGPLRPAADAHIIDTTALTIEAALRTATAIIDGTARPGR